jgi:HK97 gp10 family phage protein
MAFTFQIKNLAEVLKDFDKLSVNVKQGVADELKITAYDIVNMAQQLAPVDDGNLRANIRVARDEEMTKLIESGAEYSAYMEFGTGTNVNVPPIEGLAELAMQFKGAGLQGKHPVKFKDGTWRMVPYQLNLQPRPFFFPAFQAQTAELSKRLKEIIEEAASK